MSTHSFAKYAKEWGTPKLVAVVAAFQSRPIVTAIRTLAGAVGGGSPAQARFPGIFLVGHLAAVFQLRKPCFHILKLGSVHDILRLCRENRRDLLLRSFNPVRSLRMRRKSFGQGSRLLLLLRLNLFEEGYERLRIVPGLIHILQTEIIGLGFKPT